MSSTIVDAKLRISAEERASAEVAKVVKAFREMEQATKVSASIEKLTRSLLEEERALKAVNAVASAQSGLTKLRTDLQQAEAALKTQARALDAARQARAAFEGVKITKGSEQAQQAQAAAKALREASAAYRTAENEVRKVNAAIAAQTTTAQQAERVTKALGRDVSNLASAEQAASASVERTTAALRQQIRAEDQAAQAARASATAQKEAAVSAQHAREQALRDQVRAAERAAREQSRIAREEARDLKNQRAADAREQRAEAAQTARQQMRWAVEAGRAERQERLRNEQDLRRHRAMEAAEYDRHMRRHGVVGTAAGAAAGYVGVHSVGHGIVDSLKAGARYQHEVVALKNAGRTPEEMREIEHASDATVRKVPTATFEENLKVINETTGAFGSLHHAIENLEFMQKSAAVLHAAAGDKIHDGAGELGNKLARFFEMRGTAGHTEVFQKEASEMVRAMIFTRGNFNPGEMVNFAQQAKASLPLYSERFMSKIVPSLVTEYGGDRAGTAANAFRNVIMGKANDKKQAEAWRDLGLLDPNKAIMKGGYAVSWTAGAIKDTNTALSDPLEWAEKVLIPALQKKGVNVEDKLELSKALGTLFRNSNSNLFAEALTQKLSRSRLHKDEDNINKSGTTDEVYKRNLSEDPTEALKAVKAGVENLISTASSPLMSTAASGLKALAEGIQSLSIAAKDHPNLAVAGGVSVAGAGLAGAGYLSYKLATGFGLSTSAAALNASAVALDAAALKLGGIPGGTLPAAAKAVPAFVGFGLGAATTGVLAGGAFAGYATAKTMPEVVKEKGAGGMDAATGGTLEESPMAGLAPDRPWLADWWRSHAPVLLGGEPAKEAVREAGKDAGHAAGDGVAAGVKEKAPDVEAQGKSLFERFKAIFADGIRIPIGFTPGDGAAGGGGDGRGLIHRASFGGVDSDGGSGVGGIVRGGRVGSAGSSSGYGGAMRRGGLDLSTKGADPEVAAYIREAAKRNGIDPDVATAVANSEALRAFDPKKTDRGGDNGTSFGPFQLHYGGGTGANRQRGLGDRFTEQTGKDARDASTWRDQVDFALKTAKREGWGAWHGARNTGIGPWDGLRGDGAGLRVKGGPGGQAFGGGETHPSLLAIAKDLQKAGGVDRFTAFNDRYHAGTRSKHARGLAADVTGDPARIMANAREVMAAAGMVEGQDFRLIDEYARPSAGATGGHVHFEFRSRRAANAFARARDLDKPPPGPKVPEGQPDPLDRTLPPGGGFGGRGDMQAAATRMHEAVDRMENVGWRSHHTVEVTAAPGVQARTTGMRASSSGPVKADVGVSMPQTKSNDWI